MSLMFAAILAGGESRRMGTDKARLVVDGEPLLERTARLCTEAQLSVLVAGRGRPVDFSGGDAVRFVLDEPPGQGPLGGLRAALLLAGGAVLVLPCDLPRLSVEALRFFVAAAREAPPRRALVLVRDGAALPLPAIYTPACLPFLEARLAAGRRSLKGLLSAMPIDQIEAPAWLWPSLHNANTPADL